MEFVVFHPDEFEAPGYMFVYSFMAISTAFLVQITNMLMLLNEDSTEGIIGKFV